MKRTLIFFVFYGFTFLSSAQSIPDVSGHWNGLAEVALGRDVITEYYLTQRGAIIQGYSTSMSLDGLDSAKMKITGSAKSGGIEIRQTEYVYRTRGGCLSNIKLSYIKEDGQEKLVGKWSGSISKKTCPPGASGKIELLKVVKNTSPVQVSNRTIETTATENSTDGYGLALYEELKTRKYYALLIGIEEYDDEGIQDLDEPVSDVEKLAEVLQGSYNFSSDHTQILKNPNRDQIIDAFDGLSMIVKPTDQVLVFYAGHGIWVERMQQGYWLPSDARKDSKSRWLSNSTIRDYIGGINSKHTLLITDACFSGSIFKERAVNIADGRAMLERYKLISRKAMTSGTLKTVPDKSVFVEYMIKNLVTNDQALISAEDLFRGFKTAVINNSTNGQVPQYGAIGQVGDEGGDFIFIKLAE